MLREFQNAKRSLDSIQNPAICRYPPHAAAADLFSTLLLAIVRSQLYSDPPRIPHVPHDMNMEIDQAGWTRYRLTVTRAIQSS